MNEFRSHTEVEADLEQVDALADIDIAQRLIRVSEFTKHIERLSGRDNYLTLWPDRAVSETAISVAQAAPMPVTIYTWHRDGFVMCLEQRIAWETKQPVFRWLLCRPVAVFNDHVIEDVISTAIKRARDNF